MKKFLAIILSLFVVSSMAFAKPTNQLDFATLSKADSQFLFQDSAKVVTLDKAEMKQTEGEWVWNVIGGIAGGYASGLGYLIGAGDDFTAHGFESAFGSGFIGGFLSPGRGIGGAIATTSVAFVTGWFSGWY